MSHLIKTYHIIYSAENPDNAAMLETMIQRAKDLTAKECLGMVRCISTALSLVNAAEVQHRLRSIKRHERESGNIFPGPLYHTEDSVKGSIQALLQKGEATPEEIWKQLATQKVERTYYPIFTLKTMFVSVNASTNAPSYSCLVPVM